MIYFYKMNFMSSKNHCARTVLPVLTIIFGGFLEAVDSNIITFHETQF